MKYAFVNKMRSRYAITFLCKVMGVSPSGYYDWLKRPESIRDKTNRQHTARLRCLHKASFEAYGAPRLHQDLLEAGEKVSKNRVARLMSKARIQAKTAKRFVITTHSKNTLAPAED